MVENVTNMVEDGLNPTDVDILELLAEGRETRGSLTEQLDKHSNYISDRLQILRLKDLVRVHHEGTALYEITDKGRGEVGNK